MKKLLILLFLGLIIRLFFIPNPGFAADIAYWKSWSLAAAEKGIVWTTLETNYNYAPAFLYYLKAVGSTYLFLAQPINLQAFWQATNLLFLLLIKLLVIIVDLLTAYGLWWLLEKHLKTKTPKRINLPLIAAGFYLFNPFIIFNGAYWGQVGSIGTGLLFLSLILLWQKKSLRAIGVITLAFLLKLQMLFYLPLLLLWIFKKEGWQKLITSLGTMTIVFFLVCLPFILSHHMEKVTTLILASADYFPYLSLNAYNLWWLFAKGAGFTTIDRILVFGITPAKFIGLFLFFVFYLLSLSLLWQKTNKKTLIKTCLWVALAFFMLPTQMHERYIYPAFLFLALMIPEISQLYQEKPRSIKLYFYLLIMTLLPLTCFYNLHNVLAINYPQYALSILAQLNFNELTLIVAGIHLILFLGLSIIFIKEINPRLSLTILSIAAFIIISKQAAFLATKEIPLTKITPIYQKQDYGLPMKNLTVNSAWGPKSWSFLSSNYFFYRQGLGSHANSQIIYPLNGQFKRFTTDVGIDAEAGIQGTVEFKILADGQLLYESGKVGRFDLPRHAEVNIEKAQNLELIITDAQDGINDDHADWLNPTLYK
ncbi:MAG TPA: NPCBM/NEW2 domain-containing protein [Patescibacteria group bacterium]|nr:NPCBM/NEW2 domain-containing protein [Patescibacteria group bacterium]